METLKFSELIERLEVSGVEASLKEIKEYSSAERIGGG